MDPVAATLATCAPSMYSRTFAPSYVPTTRCQAPVDGNVLVWARPTPAISHFSTFASSVSRYWLSLAPFCRMRRLPPVHAVGLIHATTEIWLPGFSDGELGTVTYALVVPSKFSALPNRPV